MRTLAIIAATIITVAASHAQDPVERTWGAGGKPALKAPGSFPTSDPRSPVCEENASGGGSCDYKLAPVRTIEDSASISCGSDANVGLVIDSTLICSDDGGNKRRLAVRGSIATHDDTTMATNGACTSANGCTMNDELEEGTGGIAQDGNLRTLGAHIWASLDFTMNAGPEYFKFTGEGPTAGANSGEKQNTAEMPTAGFTGVEQISWIAKDSGGDPVNLGDDVTFKIGVDNTDGSTLCTFASGSPSGTCDAGTPIPNKSATNANLVYFVLDSASVSATDITLDIYVRLY